MTIYDHHVLEAKLVLAEGLAISIATEFIENEDENIHIMELVELLHYFENSTPETAAQCKSERVLEIHERISRIKASEEIGVRYVQEWEEKAYERAEGKEEGSMEHLTAQVIKKLAKGKTVAEIADALEEDEAVIADLVKKLEDAGNKAIDDTGKI